MSGSRNAVSSSRALISSPSTSNTKAIQESPFACASLSVQCQGVNIRPRVRGGILTMELDTSGCLLGAFSADCRAAGGNLFFYIQKQGRWLPIEPILFGANPFIFLTIYFVYCVLLSFVLLQTAMRIRLGYGLEM